MDFIDGQKAMFPEMGASYDGMGELYQQKLWHQLSVMLYDFLFVKENCRGSSFHDLYVNFIRKFDTRVNQVILAQLACFVATTLPAPAPAIEFLESVLENRVRLGPEASMVLDMDIVKLKVILGSVADAKVLLEEGKEKISKELASSESVVFSKFYGAETEYRKAVGPPQEFYKSGLMLLVYTPSDKMPPDERYVLATDMAIAAMTADEVYNFGEVLATPILAALDGTPNQWMRDMVVAMNNGSIAEFNTIVDTKKDSYYAQPALASRHEVVKQKLLLLALINMASKMHSHDRIVPFTKIAETCMTPIDQVEWVLMRAMSLKLIKGSIDEVQQAVEITWVVPRVLDVSKISALGVQMNQWGNKVKDMLVNLEDQTVEIC